MNFSTIEWAKEKYLEYRQECQNLKKQVEIHLFTLSRSYLNDNEERKGKIWEKLKENADTIEAKIKEVLNALGNTHFPEGGDVLEEEKGDLVWKFNELLNDLRKVKEVISQQFERKIISITPFQQKTVKTGYCYFCDVNIASGFAYELKKEEQVVFGIRVAQGAKFCSRECLEEYCAEYKKWDKLQQEKKQKIKNKIAEDRRLLTESEIRVAKLRSKMVEAEKKELEMKLLQKEGVLVPEKENTSSWKKFWQNIGLARKPNPAASLEGITKEKKRLEIKLEEENKKLLNIALELSFDEQTHRKWEATEKKLLQLEEKIETEEE